MNKFPSQPDQLTKTWLSESLGYNVNDFTVEPLGEGIGVIGLVTRVTLYTDENKDKRPTTIIAKFPAAAIENRAVANTYTMYLREYQFYTQIGDLVPVRAPACLHAEYDYSNDNFVLLLEELKDYRLGDQVIGCTVEEAELIVKTLATFHRSTWNPERANVHNSEAQVQGMSAGFEAGWPAVHVNFPHLVTNDIFDRAVGMHKKVRSLLDRICRFPLCIVHGDLRLDNVFFADDHIALVDFQATCQSAPEHDIAYFITQSLKSDVRNAKDWVHIYHENLTSDGINYSLEDCRNRYRQCALYFLCYAVVICSVLDLGNERGKLMAATLLENSLNSINELEAFDLLQTL
jgi:thiamine kinase-like enzyme